MKISSLLAVLGVIPSVCVRGESTYSLLYDGVVSEALRKSFQKEGSAATFEGMMEELSTRLTTEIVELYAVSKHSSDQKPGEKTLDIERRCYQPRQGGGRCSMDHHKPNDVTIHVSLDFGPDVAAANTAFRVSASLTCDSPSLSRDVMVRSIPKINDVFQLYHGMVWSIQERPSVLDMHQRWAGTASVAGSQEDYDTRLSSIDHTILGRPDIRNRMRIASANLHEEFGHSLELWQYEDPTWDAPVRALYIDGWLHSSTGPSGSAHAEAMVHPALVSHEIPATVAIFSLEPTAILHEVLKYKSIESVVLVGADHAALKMSEKYLSSVHDCSFLEGGGSCLENPAVSVVEKDVNFWFDDFWTTSDAEPFDIVLVDVPRGGNWLDMDFHRKLKPLVDEEGILIVASGSSPLLSNKKDQQHFTHRDLFLRQSHRSVDNGGLDYEGVLVFDEPEAKPLSSAFIALFPADSYALTYFVRKNTPAIEVDFIGRLHQDAQTLIYDGTTHHRYQLTSRVWQEWYCNTLPGRELAACSNFLKNWYDSDLHSYSTEVRTASSKGRSLHATTDIRKGQFILPHDAALSLRIDAQQWEALTKFVEDFPEAEMYAQLRDFILAYGFESEPLGQTGWAVSIACNNTFTNHACGEAERNAIWVEDAFYDEDGEFAGFTPVVTRKSELVGILTVAAHDIKAGDEIMMDYGAFRTSATDGDFHGFLNRMCVEGVGLVDTKEEMGEEPSADEL